MKNWECRPQKNVAIRIFVQIIAKNWRIRSRTSAIRGIALRCFIRVSINNCDKKKRIINDAEFSKNTVHQYDDERETHKKNVISSQLPKFRGHFIAHSHLPFLLAPFWDL